MNLKSSFFKFFLIILLCLTGCAVIDKRGHVVDPIQLDQIQVGVTTKEQVATLLGTPSSVATFGDRTWFYISETTQRRAFLSPTILKSNVTRIEFTPLGKVSLVDSLTEKDRQIISHVTRTTPTSGHTFGVLEQIFGNVGRFNGKDPDNDRSGR